MIHPHNKKSGQRQEGQQISPVCGAKIRDRQQAPAEDGIYDPDVHCTEVISSLAVSIKIGGELHSLSA